MKLFIGYSFLNEDKRVFNDFMRLLKPIAEDYSIEIKTARRPEPKHPIEQVLPLINECDACLFIVTKRDFKNPQGKYAPSLWIYGELVAALIKERITMIFVEDSVELGSLPEYFTQLEPFNRERIIDISETLGDYIGACLRRYNERSELRQEDIYEMEEFHSTDTIYKNGQLISTSKVILRVKDMLSNTIKIRHNFKLEDCCYDNVILGNLKTLYKKPLESRFRKQTFFFEVASDDENLIELTFGKYKKNEEQDFYVGIPVELQKRLLEENKTLTYYWGISCPKAYPRSKADIREGKLKSKSYASVRTEVEIIHKVTKLVVGLNLDKGCSLSKKPYLEVVDPSGNKKFPPLIFNKELYYNRYSQNFPECTRGYRYLIKWLPA